MHSICSGDGTIDFLQVLQTNKTHKIIIIITTTSTTTTTIVHLVLKIEFLWLSCVYLRKNSIFCTMQMRRFILSLSTNSTIFLDFSSNSSYSPISLFICSIFSIKFTSSFRWYSFDLCPVGYI